MAKPITIEFVAETAKYLRGVKGIEVSTEELRDALMAASNSSEDLSKKMTKAMNAAEKDVEGLERVIKSLPDATAKAAREAGKDFSKIGADAKEAGREVGDEFRQNLGESLSSGSLEDLVSDTLGGIVGSMRGPLGLAAAGVAGVGALIFNKLRDDWQATVTAMEGAAQALVAKQIELGREYLFQTERLEVMRDIVDDNPDLWNKVLHAAESVGFTLEDVLGAMLGTTAEADAFRQKLQDTVREGSRLEEGTGRITLTKAAADAQLLLQYMAQADPALKDARKGLENFNSVSGISVANARALTEQLDLARKYAAGLGGAKPFVAGPGKKAV